MENFELYIAGFFDGEGHCRIQTYKRNNGREYQRLIATITQVDRTVLDKIVEYVGCGQVVSKFDKRAKANGWKECHEAVFTDLSARKLLVLIEPYLIVKKEQVSSCLDLTGRSLSRKKPSAT